MAWALASMALPGEAQVLVGASEADAEPVDSSDVLGRARRQQARFERLRVRALPTSWGSRGGSDCDEIVGRFCFWFDDGVSDPPPEPPEVDSLRVDFLAYLDSVQTILPADGWITGQRVRYRAESGRWGEALENAEGCRAEAWWCAALRGLSLHLLGRYPEAEEAFQTALASMDEKQARKWRELKWLVEGDARKAVERAAEAGDSSVYRRLWALGDPLLLVEGNERLTEHYARWTMATTMADARNPFGIRWGGDMDQLTVRTGWEVAWERARYPGFETGVVGHHPPDGRSFLPRSEGVLRPWEATAEAFGLERTRPLSVYTPGAAPAVLEMEGQIAVFPRGREVVVVATHFLPTDPDFTPSRDSARIRLVPPRFRSAPTEAGVFLQPMDGAPPLAARRSGEEEGALVLRAPAGRYVVSVETFAPQRRRAGRFRSGMDWDTVPPDVLTLSDLLLLRGGEVRETSLEGVAGRALVRPLAAAGAPLALAWEVNGLGWGASEITYQVSVEKAEGGLFRRLGRALGLVSPDRPLSLSWKEAGPSEPGPVLRVVALNLGTAEPGRYTVRLRAGVPGREVLEAATALTLEAPDIDDEARVF